MTNLKENINLQKLPQHIAIIMDGNGRWAKKHGSERLFGHNNGVSSVRNVTEAATELGIKYLTLYTFSTENWNRPKHEVEGLMLLLVSTIEAETPILIKNNVRLLIIGDEESLPEAARNKLNDCVKLTENNTGLTLVLALSYSSRWELTQTVKNIAGQVKNDNLNIDDITENTISSNLVTANIPDPELLIRTSGEYRISNFLLWQLAYSELYFTEVLWPDFTQDDLYTAIINYQNRERRFGKTSEQIKA